MKKTGLFLFTGLSLAFLASCSAASPLRVQTCSPIYTMDTVVNVTFYNVTDYQKHYQEIKTIYQRIEAISSSYVSGGDVVSVYDLNEKKEAIVNEDLLKLIQLSLECQEETHGYFNPFIGELSSLWKKAIEEKKLPKDEDIQLGLAHMKETSLEINGNQVKLLGEGKLDFGGIAKGAATELARQYLMDQSITSYSIDAGNSSMALGSKDGASFTMGLSKSYTNGYYGTLSAMDIVVSTSGPKYQYFEVDGAKYHHLISPMTGYPSNFYESVFITNQDAARGDAYSTAVYAMEESVARSFLEEKKIDGVLARDGSILFTSEGIVLNEKA